MIFPTYLRSNSDFQQPNYQIKYKSVLHEKSENRNMEAATSR